MSNSIYNAFCGSLANSYDEFKSIFPQSPKYEPLLSIDGPQASKEVQQPSKLSRIQRTTATIALIALATSAVAWGTIAAGYLEHKVMSAVTLNHFTTFRAAIIMYVAPFLLTVGKVSLVVAAAATTLWVVETLARAAYDVHQRNVKPVS